MIQNSSRRNYTFLDEKEVSDAKTHGANNHTIRLRVQNICCAKEVNLIKNTLKDVVGINTVFVNVIGRMAFISHDQNIIPTQEIIDKLNALHLGISLMEKGSNEVNNTKSKLYLALRIITFVVLTILFITTIVAHTEHLFWVQWSAIAIYIIGGIPMLYKALLDLKRCVLANINLLMLIAVAGTIGLKEWLDGSIIIYVFYIATLLESICRYKVEKDIAELMLTSPDTAVLAETNETVSVEEIPIGTLILICAGEKIALDGEVVKGRAAVDESSLTGEATPVTKVIGKQVFAGTIIQSGYLKVETTCDASSSTISKVSKLMEEAQAKSSRSEEILNTFAKFYTPIILIVSFLVFIVPFILYKMEVEVDEEHMREWGIRALIILVVACPCSIIMAAPIAMISGITNAAKNGALIKGSMHLEMLSMINLVAFDKTGTLTEGRFQVIKEYSPNNLIRNEALKKAAALETKSTHPIASTIINHYSGCITSKISELGAQVGLPDVSKFKNEDGLGLSGLINNQIVLAGNLELMQNYNMDIDEEYIQCHKAWLLDGCTVVFVAVDNEIQLVLALADKCRATAAQCVNSFRRANIACVMLTGDAEGPALMIKAKLNLEDCIHSMKPKDKYNWVMERKEETPEPCIAMVGDGVNDSPALAAADVGIAIGPSATALAVESAGVSLMSDNLMKLVDLALLARYCRRIVWQNIIGSVTIKVIMVGVALSGHGLLWLAILSDVLGLLFVTLNGLRPLRWSPKQLVSDTNENQALLLV